MKFRGSGIYWHGGVRIPPKRNGAQPKSQTSRKPQNSIRMKTMRTLLLLPISIAVLMSGCKKEEGPTGPQGPAGPQGNANVNYEVIAVSPGDWAGDGDGYQAVKTSTVITQEIFDKGAVLCYFKSGEYYVPVPLSFAGSGYTSHFYFFYKPNEITFITADSDGLTLSPGQINFKVVAVASKSLLQQSDVDLNNYEEVKEALHLED